MTIFCPKINDSRLIPDKHIYRILCFLSAYGLKIDGYQLTFDESDGALSGRKWVEDVETIEDGGFAYIVKEYRFRAADYFDLL